MQQKQNTNLLLTISYSQYPPNTYQHLPTPLTVPTVEPYIDHKKSIHLPLKDVTVAREVVQKTFFNSIPRVQMRELQVLAMQCLAENAWKFPEEFFAVDGPMQIYELTMHYCTSGPYVPFYPLRFLIFILSPPFLPLLDSLTLSLLTPFLPPSTSLYHPTTFVPSSTPNLTLNLTPTTPYTPPPPLDLQITPSISQWSATL